MFALRVLRGKVAPEVRLNSAQLDAPAAAAGRRAATDSESEGGDQPSAENSASSGSRSTPLNKPNTVQKKRPARGGRKARKKPQTRELLRTSSTETCQHLSSGVDFFCAAREKPAKHKVEREKCEATGRCVSTRRQDPVTHAVQCDGT